MKVRDEMKEISAKDIEELEKKVAELEEELMKLRFRHRTGQLRQTSQLSTLRGKVARTKTVISSKRRSKAANM